jgi:hypothetical protein
MFEQLAVGLLVFNALLTLWALRQLSFALSDAVEDLDARIAKAIQAVLSGDMLLPEPVNPIQAAIAQMLTNNLTNAPIDIARKADGTFSER